MRHVLALADASQGPRQFSRIRLVTVAGSAVALLAGCGALGGGGSSGASAAGGTTITVASVPSVGDAPLYLAQHNKLFTQHGLTVTIKNYQSLQAETEALANGQADIAAGDYTDFFSRVNATFKGKSGTTLRVIADGYDAAPNVMEVLTLPNSKITSPADLQGKKVVTPPGQPMPGQTKLPTNTPYNVETLATQAVLRNDGVSITSITWQAMPPGQEVNALADHKANAILVGEPYLFQAQKRLGAVSVLDSASGVTDGLPLVGYFTTSAYAQAHSASVKAFQAALLQAQTDAASRGPIQSMLSSAIGVSQQDAPLISLGSYPTFFSIGQIQRVADLMYDAGMLPTQLDVRTLAMRP